MLPNRKNNQNSLVLPLFYNVTISKEKEELYALVKNNSSIEVLDEIEGQLKELIKLRNPKKILTPKEIETELKHLLNGKSIDDYGVWVYYPWLNKIIHLLSEKEFVEVRTNRNHYKITPKEEEFLSRKKIGIIGLSVGKSIALTIALERICGELVLADFDEIELSNLNRIQTGVQNFGVKKTIVVAREIAEIDPFLKVTCYNEGLTEENVDDFFTKNGKLDICIEVCDGLFTKILARQKAKEFKIPVVMNSSDKGTTDIERYDLNPNLPILHGLIDHLDLTLLKEAKTNEQKVPYLLPMLGVDTASNRLKASMLEIQETITTWPQLASGVVFGGGICTDVCRRILLNQFTKSGRYFVDVEEQINDNTEDYISKKDKETKTEINLIPETSLEDYISLIQEFQFKYVSAKKEKIRLDSKILNKLIEAAITAPSGGNIQPWKWIYKNELLYLFNDLNRKDSILNYNNNANHIGLGAAAQNLILTANEQNLKVEVKKFPLGLQSNLIAVFTFQKQSTEVKSNDLSHFLFKRATNRSITPSSIISKEIINKLKESVTEVADSRVSILEDKALINEVKEILIEIDRLFLTNKSGHYHFTNEIRWSVNETELTKDGVDLKTIDLTPTEEAGLTVAKNWKVVKYSKEWNLGKTFGKLTSKAIDSSFALGMLVLPKKNKERFFDGGMALEQLWLTATKYNVGFQPIAINTFLSARIETDNFEGIEELKAPLTLFSERLNAIFKVENSEQNIFCFRITSCNQPKAEALRRELKDVFIND